MEDIFFSPELVLDINDLSIDKKQILKSLQVPENKEDLYLRSLINELLDQAVAVCSPKARYLVVGTSELNKDFVLSCGEFDFHLDKIIGTAMKKNAGIAFFVGTAGPEVEKLSRKYISDKDTLEGFIVDLIGSEIAEATAEFVHRKIAADMALKGWNSTNRYSPGYCLWPVSDQQQIFKLFGEKNCGITLTESSLMIPMKSVSGIVGIGPEVRMRNYRCNRCSEEQCIYRDKR